MEEDGHELCKEREKRLQQKLNILQKAVLTSQQTCSKLSFELRAAQQERLKFVEESAICQENFRQLQDDYRRLSEENSRYKDKMKRYISHNVELRNRLGKLHEINEFLVKTLENYKNGYVKDAAEKHNLDKKTMDQDEDAVNPKEVTVGIIQTINNEQDDSEKISQNCPEEDETVVASETKTMEQDKNIVNQERKRSGAMLENSDNEAEIIRQVGFEKTSENNSESEESTDTETSKTTQDKFDDPEGKIMFEKMDIKLNLERHFATVLSKAKTRLQDTSNLDDSKESKHIPSVWSAVNHPKEDLERIEGENEQKKDTRKNYQVHVKDVAHDLPRIEIHDLGKEKTGSFGVPVWDKSSEMRRENREDLSAEDDSVTSADADIMKYITKNFKLGGMKMDRLCACPSKWCMHQLLKSCNIKSELV